MDENLKAMTDLFEKLSIYHLAQQEMEKVQVNGFNIFTILRKPGEEVALHSRFLAELLSPKGSHGKGDVFQKLFIEQVINNAMGTKDDDWQRSPISTDSSVSCYYESSENVDGRIDLVLRRNDCAVVIENKIYAKDQKSQLKRYFEAAKEWVGDEAKVYVVYLNLYGEDVSNYGRGGLADKDYGIITYETDIKNWLELCAKEAFDVPHLRETIVQYKRLVERLTGQTLSAEHKMDIKKLLEQGNNFKLAFEVSKTLESIQLDTQMAIWRELKESLKNKGFTFNYVGSTFEKKEKNSAEFFEKEFVKKYYDLRSATKHYGLECRLADFQNEFGIHFYIELGHRLYFGFAVSKGEVRGKHATNEKLKTLCSEVLGLFELTQEDKGEPMWWLGGKIGIPKRMINMKTIDAQGSHFTDLVNPEKRKEWIEETSDQIITLINKFNEKFDSLNKFNLESASSNDSNALLSKTQQ